MLLMFSFRNFKSNLWYVTYNDNEMGTNTLFSEQIPVSQLVVDPRDLAGCVIYVGHVSSIVYFTIDIFNTTFVATNYIRLLKK